jgi:hypothetical protein
MVSIVAFVIIGALALAVFVLAILLGRFSGRIVEVSEENLESKERIQFLETENQALSNTLWKRNRDNGQEHYPERFRRQRGAERHGRP